MIAIGNDEEFVLLIMTLCFTGSLLAGMIHVRWKLGARRLDILEQVVKSGTLEPQTRALLVAQLNRPGVLGRLAQGLWGGGKLLLVLGWIALLTSIAMFIEGSEEETAIYVGIAGFGLLSIPFALRELERRPVSARQ
jgi:hypothetical protein